MIKTIKVVLILFFIFSCTKVIKKKKPITKGCRLSVILNHKKVCLDGIWYLNKSFIGENKPFKFAKERNYLYLKPVLTKREKNTLKTKIKANELDTFSVENVLSLQGYLRLDNLFIEQRNPLKLYPQIYQYRLRYINGHFEGFLIIHSKIYGNSKHNNIILSKDLKQNNNYKDDSLMDF